jgi:vacuolar protein sorting-associated protein 13A/C
MKNIEIVTKPIVFRASYRDINLITSIINRAIERYGQSQESLSKQKVDNIQNADHQDILPALSSTYDRSRSQSVGKARVLMSKEQASNAYVDTKNF